MKILITDSERGAFLWKDGEALRPLPCPAECPYCPAASRERLFLCCRKNRDCWCLSRRTLQAERVFPAPPALAAACPSPCGKYLYLLSTEADAVQTVSLETGELCYAAPAGVFPRSMKLHPSGRLLLCAGGAVNEACLLNAPGLTLRHIFYPKNPCFGADFWREGVVLLCAVEGENLQTAVCLGRPGRPRTREIQRLPGQPGALCVCPDGVSALLSTPYGLMKRSLPGGELEWNLPEWALCMGLCCQGGMALVSHALCGRVCLLNLRRPWENRILFQGTDAQACFLPEEHNSSPSGANS